MICDRATAGPIFAKQRNQGPKNVFTASSKYLLKTSCKQGALQVELRGSLREPLGALWEAGACACIGLAQREESYPGLGGVSRDDFS